MAVGGWNPAAFYLLYWLPHPIQFGSFLLLPLFYLQVGAPAARLEAWLGLAMLPAKPPYPHSPLTLTPAGPHKASA